MLQDRSHEITLASEKGPSMITPRNGSTRPDDIKLGPEIINDFERSRGA
jgi:hypothetical protein